MKYVSIIILWEIAGQTKKKIEEPPLSLFLSFLHFFLLKDLSLFRSFHLKELTVVTAMLSGYQGIIAISPNYFPIQQVYLYLKVKWNKINAAGFEVGGSFLLSFLLLSDWGILFEQWLGWLGVGPFTQLIMSSRPLDEILSTTFLLFLLCRLETFFNYFSFFPHFLLLYSYCPFSIIATLSVALVRFHR